jgi:hypothetical protein
MGLFGEGEEEGEERVLTFTKITALSFLQSIKRGLNKLDSTMIGV